MNKLLLLIVLLGLLLIFNDNAEAFRRRRYVRRRRVYYRRRFYSRRRWIRRRRSFRRRRYDEATEDVNDIADSFGSTGKPV
uniref:Uncharacterized protein n=1 Tax=Ciona savignyi TaxID=51511 RepID=H2Y9B3_CIOSA